MTNQQSIYLGRRMEAEYLAASIAERSRLELAHRRNGGRAEVGFCARPHGTSPGVPVPACYPQPLGWVSVGESSAANVSPEFGGIGPDSGGFGWSRGCVLGNRVERAGFVSCL